jgi:hypothetical protein
MKRELVFEDGSALEATLDITVKGTMASAAFQRILEFLDYELPDEPDIALQAEGELLDLDEDVLDEEDLEDITELDDDLLEWDEEEEEWEEEEEDVDETWDEEEDLFK